MVKGMMLGETPTDGEAKPVQILVDGRVLAGAITRPDIVQRNMPFSAKEVSREILLAFWKVHILHHASEEPLHGQWMTDELRHHGYRISPGTLYPLLARMERLGWLKSKSDRRAGPRARRDYRLTVEGKKVLAHVREQIEELYEEVVEGKAKGKSSTAR
jgi:PadR family transcriptional regulator, regulatory protein PadR